MAWGLLCWKQDIRGNVPGLLTQKGEVRSSPEIVKSGFQARDGTNLVILYSVSSSFLIRAL